MERLQETGTDLRGKRDAAILALPLACGLFVELSLDQLQLRDQNWAIVDDRPNRK